MITEVSHRKGRLNSSVSRLALSCFCLDCTHKDSNVLKWSMTVVTHGPSIIYPEGALWFDWEHAEWICLLGAAAPMRVSLFLLKIISYTHHSCTKSVHIWVIQIMKIAMGSWAAEQWMQLWLNSSLLMFCLIWHFLKRVPSIKLQEAPKITSQKYMRNSLLLAHQ